MTSPRSVVEAIQLRRWALRATPSPPPPTSEAGWALFLEREACAVRLLPRVPEPPEPLRRRADEELQRILLLRLELDAVLKVAAELELRPVVLKGGAALNDPDRAVVARDLDLLLDPTEAKALAAGLDRAGWIPRGRGAPHHFAERIRPGGIPVEIHPALAGTGFAIGPEFVERAVPYPGLPGALRLAPADHVRHVAHHQTIQHTSHRGRLRDLFLLGDAFRACDGPPDPSTWGLPADLVPAHRVILDLARRVANWEGGADPTEETALLWYLLDAEVKHPPRTGIGRLAARWTFDLAAGGPAASLRWSRMFEDQFETWSSLLVRSVRLLVFPLVLLIATRRLARLRSVAADLVAADQGIQHSP